MQSGMVIKVDNHLTSQHGGILEIGDFLTLFVVFVFCSSLLAVCSHNSFGNGRKDISLHVCPRWPADGSNILGREVSGRLNSHV